MLLWSLALVCAATPEVAPTPGLEISGGRVPGSSDGRGATSGGAPKASGPGASASGPDEGSPDGSQAARDAGAAAEEFSSTDDAVAEGPSGSPTVVASGTVAPAATPFPLTFRTGTPLAEVRAALAAHPEGVALDLDRAGKGWTGDDVEALVYRSIEARNLRSLDLSGNPIGAPGAMAVAASPHLAGLRRLDLSGCGIGEAGARGLAYSEGLGALEWLRIDTKDAGTPGLAELKERFGERVVFGP